jgi:hypothetical protein
LQSDHLANRKIRNFPSLPHDKFGLILNKTHFTI